MTPRITMENWTWFNLDRCKVTADPPFMKMLAVVLTAPNLEFVENNI